MTSFLSTLNTYLKTKTFGSGLAWTEHLMNGTWALGREIKNKMCRANKHLKNSWKFFPKSMDRLWILIFDSYGYGWLIWTSHKSIAKIFANHLLQNVQTLLLLVSVDYFIVQWNDFDQIRQFSLKSSTTFFL